MIAYDLQCSQGHVFEGWFEDDRAYKSQKRKGLLTCPVCNETEVCRVPSTFAIKSANGSSSGTATAQVNLDQIGKKWLISSKIILTMSAATLPRKP